MTWILSFFIPLLLATTFIERPFPTTVQDAPLIVRGKIGQTRPEWVNGIDGARRIFTYYDLNVTESIKGGIASGSAIQIRELGGEKDGMGMQVSGTAHFDPEEDTVVFLGEKNGDQSYDVHGMMMGKYNLRRDSDGQEYLVGPGIAAHHRDGQNDPDSEKKWYLQDLRTLVKSGRQAAPPQDSTTDNEKRFSASSAPPATTAPDSASALHSPIPEGDGQQAATDGELQKGWLLAVVLVLGAAIALFFWMRRSRR